MARIEKFNPSDLEILAPRLHPGNIREAWALFHLDGKDAVAKSIAESDYIWTGFDKDEVIAIFGVGSRDIMQTIGYPWLVCRDDIAEHAIAFLKTFRKVLVIMQKEYPILEGYIDSRNTEVLKMCKWAGYDILPSVTMGIEGLPFNKIIRKRGDR